MTGAKGSFERAQRDYRAGHKAEAEAVCRRLIEADPLDHRALHLLGVMALDVKQYALAAHLLMRAINCAQQHAVYYVNLATALHGLGKLAEAVDVLKLAISLNPNMAEAHFNLARVLSDLGDSAASFESAERAVQLAPNHPEMLLEYARRLQRRADYARASDAYRKVLRLRAPEVAVLLEYAAVLRLERQFDQATKLAEAALQQEPQSVAAHVELAKLLLLKEREVAAIELMRAALELQPDNAEVYVHLGYALDAVGRVEDAIVCMQRSVELTPDDHALLSNVIFLQAFSRAASPHSLLEAARGYAARFAPVSSSGFSACELSRDPGRRLRIGYVSGNFYNHCQAFFTLPLLEHHDMHEVEVHCYSDVGKQDQTTERIRRAAQVWEDTSNMSHAELVAVIRRDQIDVLIDLTMHMGGSRLPAFAQKAAPIQICWLAYPGTTGLDTMDYRVTDRYLDPPESLDWPYSEQSLVLPDSFWCYDPLTNEVEPGPLPAARERRVTFGCLNHVRKVNETTLQLWARVMHRVDGSTLLLHAPSDDARERILDVLSAAGIGPRRVTFVGRLPRLDYLKLYQQIDIGLDTFPCQGHTTSLDACWMGVPVVSLIGKVLVGRAALTLATNLGLPELVATREEQFVETAVRLADNLDQLALMRANLRPRMQACPLMNASRFARNMEAAYRLAWRRHCAGAPHEPSILVGFAR